MCNQGTRRITSKYESSDNWSESSDNFSCICLYHFVILQKIQWPWPLIGLNPTNQDWVNGKGARMARCSSRSTHKHILCLLWRSLHCHFLTQTNKYKNIITPIIVSYFWGHGTNTRTEKKHILHLLSYCENYRGTYCSIIICCQNSGQ